MKLKYHYTLSLFFVVAVVYIGYWLGPLILHRESLALFVFDASFASRLMDAPSGVIDYAVQFVSQFFLYPWVGAVMLASALTYIAWGISKWASAPNLLSMIVPVWLLALLGDATFDLKIIFSVALVVLAAQSTIWFRTRWISAPLTLIVAIVAPAWGVVLSLMIVAKWLAGGEKNVWSSVITTIAAAWVGIACDYWLLYPAYNFANIFTLNIPLASTLVLIPIVSRLASKMLAARTLAGFALVGAGLTVVVLTSPLKSTARTLLDMDGKIRSGDYQAVVDIASKETELSRQHCFYVALAQAEVGTMCDDLYKFPQKWGSEVLYHKFSNEPLELFMTAEMYSRLGHWNYAYRSAMEGVVINARPSARMLAMMARAAAANGERPLVEKYMNTLKSTLFYRDATKDIEANLTKIRREMPRSNMSLGDGHNSYLFLSKAHSENPDNRLVYEYLISDIMLKGRLDLMVKYLPAAEKFYTTLPTLLQQAILVYWAKTGNGSDIVDRYVMGEQRKTYTEFTKTMTDAANRPLAQRDKMFEPYRDTYFYYITSETVKK